MALRGCCPPLALPRAQLGGEIIGFNERTGQFVQAAAGRVPPTRVTRYPYYASAGLRGTAANAMWVGLGALAIVSLYVTFASMKEAA